MKKIIFLSGIAAAFILTGCWESSGGTSNVPDYFNKQASINSPSDVAKLLVMTNEGNEEEPLIKKIKNKSEKIKNLDINPKSKIVAKAVTSFKKLVADARENQCMNTKHVNEIGCQDGGKIIETKIQKREGDICKIILKFQAQKCKFIESLKKGTDIFYSNGYLEFEKDEYMASNKTETVYFKIISKGTSSYEYLDDKNNTIEKEQTSSNYLFEMKENYNIETNNTFVDLNKTIIKWIDKSIYQYFQEKNLTTEITSNINLVDVYERLSEERDKDTFNGWIDLKQKDLEKNGSYTLRQYGEAFKNFVVDENESNDTLYSIWDGKVGNACLKGMVNVETNKTVESNASETNNSVLPYSGKLFIEGKGKATVEFYKDENNQTHAIVSVGDKNKTYDSWDDILKDANSSKCLDRHIYLPEWFDFI